MTNDPTFASATELVAAFRRKTLSPVEVTDAVLKRIERFDPAVRAFSVFDPESAKAEARASEARWHRGAPKGLADGVPTTIKDLILTAGWPSCRGSRAINPAGPWLDDAPATARLREHGAVLLGKTTTPEFGWKAVTDSPLTGITRNPWDLARTPGGSSGGAAAACALGLGALHVGTDGGGSIRIPAGFTGIVGLKPSFGRVPAWPLSPFGTLAHVGPMTRTVADAALLLTILSGDDPRDCHALPAIHKDDRIGLEDGVRGLRIAFSPTLGHVDVAPEVARIVADAVTAFEAFGATVEPHDPGLGDTLPVFTSLWYAGAANLLRRFDSPERALMDPGLQDIAMVGAAQSLTDYLAAVDQRGALATHMRTFHETFDLLLTPTLPIPAFAASHDVPPGSGLGRWPAWSPFSNPFNLTQQPAASVPAGFTGDGLPVGLQIIGPMYGDDLVLRAARAFETARPFRFPDAPKGSGGS